MQFFRGSLPPPIGIVTVIALVCLAPVCLALFGLSACTLPWNKPVAVGLIVDLSGPNAFLAEVRDAMKLAVDEINASGGLNGRQVDLVVRDTRSDPERAVKAVEELEATYEPLVYISTTSSVSLALAPLARKYQVPLIGLAVMSDDLTKTNEWVFRYATSTVEEARTVVSILDHLRIKRAGVLYQENVRGAPAFAAFREIYEKGGGIAVGRPFDAPGPRLDDAVSSLAAERAVYLVGYANYLKEAVLGLRTRGYRGVIIGDVGFADLLETTPELEGTYTVVPIIYNPAFTTVRRIREEYEAAYGRKLTPPAAAGYDVIKLLAGLMEDRELTRDDTRDTLEGWFIYPGLLGNVESEAGTRDILYPLYPVRIEHGSMSYLK